MPMVAFAVAVIPARPDRFLLRKSGDVCNLGNVDALSLARLCPVILLLAAVL
jgi:hypothetical protein